MEFLAGPSRRPNDSAHAVTYRHILSPQAMTVFNPLRTIAHCDIDAAYAQFESVRLGLPDDVPLICAQWQSIIAVNYPARKYGIKRFTTIDEAKKMCPHLYIQHVATYRNGESEAGYWGEVDPKTHKVSLDPYRRESLKILAIFKEMVPKGEIEKASIDEAFLDLTPMAIDRLLAAFPHLASVPDDAPDGLDSPLPHPPPIDWSNAGNVFPADGEAGNAVITKGEDLIGEDRQARAMSSQNEASWEDWALCKGAEIMAEVRGEVWKRLHYTCSAGIAHNKAMSKLCSAWKKPNNQTVLRMSATPAFLRDMDFTDIRFLGGKLGKAIATEYNAQTVGDMLTVPLEELQKRFGEESIWVYNILRGIDHTEVTARVATKSMLASKNVRPNVRSPEQGHHWLGVLAGELNVRLRDAREISPGLWPKTLVLSFRTGAEPSRSRQIPFPFTRNLSTEYIVRFARRLWDEATQPMNKGNMRLNNIALAFTGLERLEEGQQGIEGFFAATASASATASTSAASKPTHPTTSPTTAPAVPGVPVTSTTQNGRKRSRSNSPVAPTATGLSPKKSRLPTLHAAKRKTPLETFLTRKGESSSSSAARQPNENTHGDANTHKGIRVHDPTVVPVPDDDDADDDAAWTCPKCGAHISVPVFDPTSSDDVVQSQRLTRLAAEKQEHDDWHFAMSLQDGDGGGGGGGSGGGTTGHSNSNSSLVASQNGEQRHSGKGVGGPKAKVKKKSEGIKAFFAPRSAKG